MRFTHGSKPNNPKVSRSSKVNAAPLLRLGSFKSARPRRAVQIGRYSSRGRKKVSDGGGRNFLFGRQPPKKETRRNSRWGEQPREDVPPGEREESLRTYLVLLVTQELFIVNCRVLLAYILSLFVSTLCFQLVPLRGRSLVVLVSRPRDGASLSPRARGIESECGGRGRGCESRRGMGSGCRG